MMALLWARLWKYIVALGVLLAALGCLYAYGYHKGVASVQAKWTAVKATQAIAAVKASESARAAENRQSNDFAGIATGYLQATTHAYPSLADALPAAVAAGTVRLRNDCLAAAGGIGATSAAGSRAADAAATQALADRVQTAIAAVRAGSEADAREHLLRTQVTSLQAVLMAERAVKP